MATSFGDPSKSELTIKFESWLTDKIKSNDQDTDASLFINYILSTLAEEDNTDEEKAEAIQPFLQELNQNNSFDEQKLVEEIIKTWNQMKLDSEKDNDSSKKNNENEPNPTDTILSMINKHKTQLVKVKKTDTTAEDDYEHVPDNFVYEELEEDEEQSDKKNSDLFSNSNLSDALNRDKQKREKLAETHAKQKEQAKKALIEQRQREEDKKKKAQQKAAKVERKR